MTLELGPLVRALARRRGTFTLVVLEFACAFSIISCLFLAGVWYRQVGIVHSGRHDPELIAVTLHRPLGTAEPLAAAAAARIWQERALALIRAVPGVRSAAPLTATLLDDGLSFPTRFAVAGRPASGSGWTIRAGAEVLEVLGPRILEGQSPARLPPAARAGAVVLTRCLRDELFAGAPAVGQRISSGEIPGGEVVAVVEDLFLRRPFVARTECLAFHLVDAGDEHSLRVLVRSDAPRRAAVAGALREALAPLAGDGELTVKLYTLANARHYVVTHGITVLLVVFGVNVVLVALLGPVAVSSFLVAERTHQIGVRRALGATRGDIIRYFLVENSLAVALGTAVGALLTLGLFFGMRDVFYGIALRPWIFGVTAVVLWVDGTAAALFPALRAARVAPWVAARTV
jgi:putative ABC transport system permease protein